MDDAKGEATIDRYAIAIRPGDLIVLECPGPIKPEVVDRIKAAFSKQWPDQEVVCLSDGMKLSVLRRD